MDIISSGFRKVSGILAKHYGMCLIVFTVLCSLSMIKHVYSVCMGTFELIKP